tara:strand:+ start:42 stop:800 length:759 start_codon:yes stop_codon:yes gene_type:complete
MIIDLTGSRGFIGSHLKTALEKEGHTVVEWDRHEAVKKDISQYEPSKGIGMVIHLAAMADVRKSIEQPEVYWQNNVINTTRIQKKCNEINVPLLYASSSCIHKWWLSPYGTSKKVNEETAFDRQIGLRFTTVYGDGARDTMFMGRLLSGNLAYSTNHIRDFIHVSDVVSAIFAIIKANNPLQRAYDIGNGVGNTVSDLAKLAGYDIPIKDGDTCEAENNTADVTNLINEFDWKPKINAKQYIAERIKEGIPV